MNVEIEESGNDDADHVLVEFHVGERDDDYEVICGHGHVTMWFCRTCGATRCDHDDWIACEECRLETEQLAGQLARTYARIIGCGDYPGWRRNGHLENTRNGWFWRGHDSEWCECSLHFREFGGESSHQPALVSVVPRKHAKKWIAVVQAVLADVALGASLEMSALAWADHVTDDREKVLAARRAERQRIRDAERAAEKVRKEAREQELLQIEIRRELAQREADRIQAEQVAAIQAEQAETARQARQAVSRSGDGSEVATAHRDAEDGPRDQLAGRTSDLLLASVQDATPARCDDDSLTVTQAFAFGCHCEQDCDCDQLDDRQETSR